MVRFPRALCALMGALLLPAMAIADPAGVLVRDTTLVPAIEQVVDTEQISALEEHSISTSTDFTDGVSTFTGPLVRDVIALVGGRDWTVARMVAANDYAVEIPVSDFRRYDVILAHTQDGRRLSLRDKGPYWVMYPLDSHQELDDPVYNNRLIWQLVKIELQ